MCSRIMHKAWAELVNKKYWWPPDSPTVAGPTCKCRSIKLLKFQLNKSDFIFIYLPNQPKCLRVRTLHSLFQNLNQIHMPKCVYFQLYASYLKLTAVHFQFLAEHDRFHIETSPAEEIIIMFIKHHLTKYKRKEDTRRHLLLTWMRIETIIPKMVTSRSG